MKCPVYFLGSLDEYVTGYLYYSSRLKDYYVHGSILGSFQVLLLL